MTKGTMTVGLAVVLALGLGLTLLRRGPATEDSATNEPISLVYEKYELANGLDVILHVDRSDPVAAVAMTFHVGSSREVEGRTGFAHLFEHLFFLDSENLGYGGLDRLMTRVGSSTNGSTNRDRTNYYEVVPNDALEKALWAEADKLGFFINTVTESVVAKERQVVKNEKRQSVDNQPYGHNDFVIDRALYPEGHPYRWQVIGALAGPRRGEPRRREGVPRALVRAEQRDARRRRRHRRRADQGLDREVLRRDPVTPDARRCRSRRRSSSRASRASVPRGHVRASSRSSRSPGPRSRSTTRTPTPLEVLATPPHRRQDDAVLRGHREGEQARPGGRGRERLGGARGALQHADPGVPRTWTSTR